MNHFALTIVGRDRPGIVSQVTKILFDQGCNLADSSCSILGGQFAMDTAFRSSGGPKRKDSINHAPGRWTPSLWGNV